LRVALGYFIGMSIVDRVIEQLGGVKPTARACAVKHTSVLGWRRRGSIPAKKVLVVSRLTGIAAAELRPDLAKLFDGAA